jgi:hypothetical protein
LIGFRCAFGGSFDANKEIGCQEGWIEGEKSSKMQKVHGPRTKAPPKVKSWHDFCRIFDIYDDKIEVLPNDIAQAKTACLYQQIVHAESNLYKAKLDLELACESKCRRSKYLAFWCLHIKPRVLAQQSNHKWSF